MRKFLIIYEDSPSDPFICSAESIRDLLKQFGNYQGETNDVFEKALNGFEDNDSDGLIKFYNRWSWYPIKRIYEISNTIFIDKGGEDI